MPPGKSVLIVDDDPSHLRIYAWIVQSAGYQSLLAEVHPECVDLPDEVPDLMLLDYHLSGQFKAREIAQQITGRFAAVPIVLLSDALVLPADIAPHVQGFVRKGFPAQLVETLRRLLGPPV